MTWHTLDLFCGAAGGWSLGLHRAGFTTVAACEIDPWRRAVFAQNNPGAIMYDDIQKLTADRLFSDLGYFPDIICGSPPCQDASVANTKGRGVDGERTGLFFDAVRLVREVRPRWVLFENVPGLRTRGYDRVQDALEEAGYTVWPLVVGAVHAGAPHLRKRVWIIARRIAADADETGQEGGQLEPGLREAKISGNRCALLEAFPDGPLADTGGAEATRRDGNLWRFGGDEKSEGGWLDAWPDWNGGAPDISRMDDGLPQALASRRGVARAIIGAYGDAVVPQITEAIGRSIMKLSAPGGSRLT